MNISELLLDFRITAKCHLGCDLCFRTIGIGDSNLDDIYAVISKMAKIGFKRIGFTGGEPTLRKDYIEMIKFAKNLGFLTYLSTVGEHFISHAHYLEGILDWVGLPIDGIDYDTNAEIRSQSMGYQHETIRNILNALSKHSTSIKIKLTTVVSKANINNLVPIVAFVKSLPYDFDAWRFYQFCPLGLGKEKRDKLEISTEVFQKRICELQQKYKAEPISGATFEERDMANVVMEPNFDIIIPEGENYTYLCNMKKDSDDIIISSIMDRNDVIEKCAANRFWIK